MAQLQIDGEKLRKRLLDVGVKPSAASTEIGFSANYWGKAMKSGVCSEIAANALQMRYGINPDDYTVKDEEPPVSPAPQTCEQTIMLPAPEGGETVTFGLDALRGVICEAILDAAVQIAADKGLQDALNRVIYGAVYGACINMERMRGVCNVSVRRYLCRWEDKRGRMHSAIFVAWGIRRMLLNGRANKRMPDMAVYALNPHDPSAQPTPVRMYYDYRYDRVQIYDLRGHMLDSAGLPIRGQYTWEAV